MRLDASQHQLMCLSCALQASRRGSKGPRYTDIPNSQIRKIIAQRLLESKQKIPHYYLSADADLGVVSSLRKSLKEQGQKVPAACFSSCLLLLQAVCAGRGMPGAKCVTLYTALQSVLMRTAAA